jgi:DNA-binding ferritin-like protein (Dps family)
MPKVKPNNVVIIPVKLNAKVKIQPEKISSLKEAIETDLWFSIAIEISNGRNQFIVRKEDYEGEITAQVGKDEATFSFDCLVKHNIDRWMKKYKDQAPFQCVVEGVYDAEGDLHRFGSPDDDGFCPGIAISTISIETK